MLSYRFCYKNIYRPPRKKYLYLFSFRHYFLLSYSLSLIAFSSVLLASSFAALANAKK